MTDPPVDQFRPLRELAVPDRWEDVEARAAAATDAVTLTPPHHRRLPLYLGAAAAVVALVIGTVVMSRVGDTTQVDTAQQEPTVEASGPVAVFAKPVVTCPTAALDPVSLPRGIAVHSTQDLPGLGESSGMTYRWEQAGRSVSLFVGSFGANSDWFPSNDAEVFGDPPRYLRVLPGSVQVEGGTGRPQRCDHFHLEVPGPDQESRDLARTIGAGLRFIDPASNEAGRGSGSPQPDGTVAEGSAEGFYEVVPARQANEPMGSLHAAVDQEGLGRLWSDVGFDDIPPEVDFKQRVVVTLTVPASGCPPQVTDVERGGGVVKVLYEDDMPDGVDACATILLPRTLVVAIDRDGLTPAFELVLPGSDTYGYAEQRLVVDVPPGSDSPVVEGSPSVEDSPVAEDPSAAEDPPVVEDPVSSGLDLEAPVPGREITFDGAGDVHLDQVLDPSLIARYEGGGSCGFWGPDEPSHNGTDPLSGLATGVDPAAPKVLSIMIRDNGTYRTASGVGIGTTLESLRRIYGDRLVIDRADGWETPTDGLLASYTDVAAVRYGDAALTFSLSGDVVDTVKVSHADFWGDDEGCV